jgi:hypothetical protein
MPVKKIITATYDRIVFFMNIMLITKANNILSAHQVGTKWFLHTKKCVC